MPQKIKIKIKAMCMKLNRHMENERKRNNIRRLNQEVQCSSQNNPERTEEMEGNHQNLI